MKVKKDSTYFKALGTQEAQAHMQGGKEACRFFRGELSWQARAYWAGYDGFMATQPPVAINAPVTVPLTSCDFSFEGWPEGAREHVKSLQRMMAETKNKHRWLRLQRSITRMFQRHEKP
jgi:hypothetical protein